MTTAERLSPMTSSLQAEVKNRFGVLPNFFCLGGDAPEITTNLWGFAQFAYLDNPLPSLFKERLFVYLSRFCIVRYCIARHVGFLVGLGRPAGDGSCLPETVEQAVRLIRRPLLRGDGLESHLTLLESTATPLVGPPESGSAVEEAVFACITHVFLQTPQAARCLATIRTAFTDTLFQHLMVFLAFVRTAHFWTKVHPELGLEDDVKQLFATHEALAECVLNDPEAPACEMTEVILDELHALRSERGRREDDMERLLEEQRVDSDVRIRALRTETDTQLRELLVVAEHARAEAEKANRTKDEFLAMVSHELRSPMNAMMGWIRILKTAGAPDSDLVRRAVDTIERNIGVQAQTVNDLLDMSRILSGKLQLEKGRVEFEAVVSGCVQSLKPSTEDKQIVLRLNVTGEELNVLGDMARLQQVVANLLGNAIKFTDAGGSITVTVARAGASASLVIEDTGQGIAPDFLPHLFERFTQADTGSTRMHGGLGLGLSIVKTIVSLHGGRVEADSAGVGRGARFSVVLPLGDAEPRAAFRTSSKSVDEGTLGKLDVLLVEDDADTREALHMVLRNQGSRVRSVASVRQALEAYDAQPPDLVISDVGLPGENGYVLIRSIRDREEGRSRRTLAIAITGFASRDDHESALRAGFDEHVAKPVEPDDLLDRIRVLAAFSDRVGQRSDTEPPE